MNDVAVTEILRILIGNSPMENIEEIVEKVINERDAVVLLLKQEEDIVDKVIEKIHTEHNAATVFLKRKRIL